MSSGDNVLVRRIPERDRDQFCLTIQIQDRTVRGPIAKGHRPHVNLLGAVYSSPKLCAAASLLGKKLKIKIWTRDVRTVMAYYPGGGEFGRLVAQGGWGVTAHDVRVRRAILKLRRQRKLVIAARTDPVQVYHRYLAAKIRTNRRATNDLAHAIRIAAKGPAQAHTDLVKPVASKKLKPIKPWLPYTAASRFVFKTITY